MGNEIQDSSHAKVAQTIAAVLRTGGLSDFFTQDLEDMPKETLEKEQEPLGKVPPTATEQQPRGEYKPDPSRPLQGQITEPQKRAMFGSMKRFGVSEDEFKAKFGIEHISGMTKQQASEILSHLFKMQTWE